MWYSRASLHIVTCTTGPAWDSMRHAGKDKVAWGIRPTVIVIDSPTLNSSMARKRHKHANNWYYIFHSSGQYPCHLPHRISSREEVSGGSWEAERRGRKLLGINIERSGLTRKLLSSGRPGPTSLFYSINITLCRTYINKSNSFELVHRRIVRNKKLKIVYCDQIERWILNLNFPGFSKLKIFFSHKLVVLLVTSVPNFTSKYSLVFELRVFCEVLKFNSAIFN